jgi:hypothetical protein
MACVAASLLPEELLAQWLAGDLHNDLARLPGRLSRWITWCIARRPPTDGSVTAPPMSPAPRTRLAAGRDQLIGVLFVSSISGVWPAARRLGG